MIFKSVDEDVYSKSGLSLSPTPKGIRRDAVHRFVRRDQKCSNWARYTATEDYPDTGNKLYGSATR